jgi:MarR family transcriptional regulator for hemolysin
MPASGGRSAGAPASPPVGLQLARAAKEVSRAFDDALAEAGGSQPVWLVLISLKTRRLASQRELAEAVGIGEATLTHHLNAMEARGLVTRRRDPDNRRVHLVELTPAGEEAFYQMRRAAFAFNERLRAGLDDRGLAEFGCMLDRMRGNACGKPGRRLALARPGGIGRDLAGAQVVYDMVEVGDRLADSGRGLLIDDPGARRQDVRDRVESQDEGVGDLDRDAGFGVSPAVGAPVGDVTHRNDHQWTAVTVVPAQPPAGPPG